MAAAGRSSVRENATSSKYEETLIDNDVDPCIFANLQEIIECMLSQLPMRSLNRCARVCQRWNRAVKRVKKRREHIAWLTCREREKMAEYMDGKLQVLASEPRTALVFASSNFIKKRGRTKKKARVDVGDYLKQVLPPSCDMIGVVADGIVGTSHDMKETWEIEDDVAFSAILLPLSSSYSISRFTAANDITGHSCMSVLPGMLRDLTGVSADDHVKLVLLFFSARAASDSGELVEWLMRACNGRAVVAGGYVNEFLPKATRPRTHIGDDEVTVSGVVFAGASLQVASVLLDSTIQDRAAVEQALGRLQATNIGPQPRLAFLFSCVGRGRHYYGQENLESGVFRKMFPHTPLLGFFGNGEFGCDFLPDFSKTDVNFRVMEGQDVPKLRHSYTSVLVVVSIGT